MLRIRIALCLFLFACILTLQPYIDPCQNQEKESIKHVLHNSEARDVEWPEAGPGMFNGIQNGDIDDYSKSCEHANDIDTSAAARPKVTFETCRRDPERREGCQCSQEDKENRS